MKKGFIFFSAVILACLCLFSCSKEGRDGKGKDKNSYVLIDISLLKSWYKSITLRLYPTLRTIPIGENENVILREVPSGEFSYSLFSCKGGNGNPILDTRTNTLVYQSDMDIDSVYAYCESTTLYPKDTLKRKIFPLHKQFCTMFIQFAFLKDGDVELKCANNALDLLTMKAVKGLYHKKYPIGSDGVAVVRIPRQAIGAGITLSNSKMENDINLGELLSKAGYDWAAEDLRDFRLKLNDDSPEADAEIEDWEEGDEYSLTIK